MSGQTVRSDVGRKGVSDYLGLAANILYGVAGILFLVGLYFDWQHTGQIIIPQFALANEPNANSGLFILSIIILGLGYVVSVLGSKVEEWQTEKVDQTQEWTVDVGDSSKK
ncbi:hypothetical protein [Haladaptatus halobius]|uniref:hypothetical protein n=1 Tax=Haladaptatus halobius TaxID=2884875 RepID=UPI001D09B7B8|nr:hypothetical protein [Haladaptatus halobius]